MLLLLLACVGGTLDQGAPPLPGDGGAAETGDSGPPADGGDSGPPPANALWPDQALYEVGERVRIDLRGSGEVVLLPEGEADAAASPWRQTPPLPDSPVLFLPVSLAEGRWEAWLLQGGEAVATASFDVASGASHPVPGPVEGSVTAMSFNLGENATLGEGGTDAVAAAIAEAGADVVALQECSRDTLSDLAAALRPYPGYADLVEIPDVRILSRHPLIELHTASVYAYGASVRLPDGTALRVFNSHLTMIPSGLDLAMAGATPAEIRTLEGKTRAAELQAALQALVDAEAHHPERPTLLMGTHNAPSHLDWTEAAADQHWGLVIEDWPASTLMADAGFVDAFRVARPDPVQVRGFTRTPGAPRGSFAEGTVHERLDYVYARPAAGGALEVAAAWTMDRAPWPSDQRAVVARIRFDAAELR